MRILVLGCNSLLGEYTFNALKNIEPSNNVVQGSHNAQVNIPDAFFWDAGKSDDSVLQPYDVVLIFIRLGLDESLATESENIFAMNVEFMRKIVKVLSQDTQIIWISSSRVFDINDFHHRSIYDRQNPNTWYGKEKSAIEEILYERGNCSIIRLGKVFHSKIPIFNQWRKEIYLGYPIEAYKNYLVSPLSLEDFFNGVSYTLKHRGTELLHVAPPFSLSYLDIANSFKEFLKCESEVIPISYHSVSELYFDTLVPSPEIVDVMPRSWDEFLIRHSRLFEFKDYRLEK